MKRFILILILALSWNMLHASVPVKSSLYNISHYQLSNGLCDDYVFMTTIDRSGYAWICTSNGLDRFDGNDFVHYSSISSYSDFRLSSSLINLAVEDSHHQMWVGTSDGLHRIDLHSGRVIPVLTSEMAHADYLKMPTQALAWFDDEDLWMSVSGAVIRIVLDVKGNIANIVPYHIDDSNLPTLCKMGQTLWVGGTKGLYTITNKTTPESQIECSAMSQQFGISQINALLSKGNYLWIGTRHGLVCYNSQTRQCTRYEHDEADPSSLSAQGVMSLAFNNAGDLYVGTSWGLDLLTLAGFEHIPLSDNLNGSLFITALNIDANDNIWVSTMVDGVMLLTLSNLDYERILVGPVNDANLVSRILEDSDGNIFAGVLNKGLAIKLAHETEFCWITQSGLAGNVLSLVQDYQGDYWISTGDKGLYHIRHADLASMHFTKIDFPTDIQSSSIFDMVSDPKRQGIWLAAGSSLEFFDLTTRSFQHIATDLDTVSVMPYTLCLDSHDRLWVGGIGLGVVYPSVTNPATGKLRANYYKYKLDNPASQITERIAAILETPNGRLYFGSQNLGLYRLEEDKRSDFNFSNVILNYGFADNKISMLLADEQSNVWASTLNGIYVIDEANGQSFKIDTYDGLPTSRFYVRSGQRLHDGRICFGSIDGMLLMEPEPRFEAITDRIARISHVRYKDRQLLSGCLPQIDVYPDDAFFELSFSAQEYCSPDKVIYRYRIDELKENWNIDASTHKVRYTMLSPGKYTLRLSCTNADNSWSHQETLIRIIIHPAFYQTLWFWLLIAAALLSMAVLILYKVFSRQKKIQRHLSSEVVKKTDLLTDQIEKANQEKLNLFTNLTHEFRTPLTLILGPAKDLAANNKNPELIEPIGIIQRNAKYLLSLVNQIMELRRVDSPEVKLNPEPMRVSEILQDYTADFYKVLREKNIMLVTTSHISCDNIRCDKDILHKIINNLFSNASKYTPEGGQISVKMGVAPCRNDAGQAYLYISVSNTGSYIKPEDREHIFDCFFKGENAAPGNSSGVGLYLVHQLVNKLGGSVSVHSSVQSGTSFRLYFKVEMLADDAITTEQPKPTVPNAPAEWQEFTNDADDKRPVLLLVEDNDDMRAYIHRLLTDDYRVAEARNGHEGYQIARQIIPDFIVSDFMMPLCDGLQFCHMVRQDETLSHIPFLMLTALSNDQVRLNSYREGVDAFLSKPFEREMLLTRINSILTSRRSRQEAVSYDLRNAYSHVEIEQTDQLFMQRLTTVLEKNYSNPDFGVSELQKELGISSTTLYKKITALTGLSATQFIRLYRLQTARNILEQQTPDNRKNVSEVAYMVGFNDPKYFTRCFVKQYGILPSTLIPTAK